MSETARESGHAVPLMTLDCAPLVLHQRLASFEDVERGITGEVCQSVNGAVVFVRLRQGERQGYYEVSAQSIAAAALDAFIASDPEAP